MSGSGPAPWARSGHAAGTGTFAVETDEQSTRQERAWVEPSALGLSSQSDEYPMSLSFLRAKSNASLVLLHFAPNA